MRNESCLKNTKRYVCAGYSRGRQHGVLVKCIDWVRIVTLLLPGCVTSGILLILSALLSSSIKKGVNDNSYLTGLL